MIIIEKRAIAGFEQLFEDVKSRKENLASEIEDAKARAIAEVEANYTDTNARLDNLFAQVSEDIEVELPDAEQSSDVNLGE